ncbi:MAG: hypothetical protein LBP89_03015 [Helicobacteraceae bacterium]|jgi:hypothetical protein|nr:hypothetical protein [Helicobacteraceae bacterium]
MKNFRLTLMTRMIKQEWDKVKRELKNNKIVLAFCLLVALLYISNYIFPFLPLKVYYYFVNGQTIEIEHYKIDLPFPTWIINGKSKLAFVVSANKDNFAEIAIDYKKIKIDYLLNACDQIKQEYKIYKKIKGMEYLCYQTDIGATLYFLSDDSFFFLRVSDYRESKYKEELYKTLFDSVERKHNDAILDQCQPPTPTIKD